MNESEADGGRAFPNLWVATRKWVAGTFQVGRQDRWKIKNVLNQESIQRIPGLFYDFWHDMNYTAMLHIMEYPRIWSIAV